MSPTRFQIAKQDIVDTFENKKSTIYTYDGLSKILKDYEKPWRLPISMSIAEFVDLLIRKTKMQKLILRFPNRIITMFAWGEASVFGICSSLAKRGYLSHYTALFVHGLTDQIPKKIYVTQEQTPKNVKETPLAQVDIDRAFSKSSRISNNIARLGNYDVCLLNGQFTDNIGVIEQEHETNQIRVTGIERSLIDAIVRPVYCGGIQEVLKAFEKSSKI